MKEKNFSVTLGLTGPIVTIAGLIVIIVSSVLKQNAESADETENVVSSPNDLLFENYLNSLGYIMLVIGIAMLVISVLWYFVTSAPTKGTGMVKGVVRPEMEQPLAKHIVLLFVTFGVWYFIWLYHTTKLLNCFEDEPKRKPFKTLIFSIFIPFYVVYWTHLTAYRIDRLAKENGINADIDLLCTDLSVILPYVSAAIMQKRLNDVVTITR